MKKQQAICILEELVEELESFKSEENFKSLDISYDILGTSASLVLQILTQLSDKPVDQSIFKHQIYKHIELLANQTLDLEEFMGDTP